LSDKNCVTHHYACDCREKMFADRIEELEGVLDRCHLWLTAESKSYEGSMLQDHVKALLSAAPEPQ
jgi:hypothetical protein